MTEPATTAPGDRVEIDGRSPRAVHSRLLSEVAAGNITWKRHGDYAHSYRLWSSEREYRTLSGFERTALRALRSAGLVEQFDAAGFRTAPRGGFEVTAAGRALLATAAAEASTP